MALTERKAKMKSCQARMQFESRMADYLTDCYGAGSE